MTLRARSQSTNAHSLPPRRAHLLGRSLCRGLGLAAALLLAAPIRAEYEETFSFSSRSLAMANLIGKVNVEGASGSDFEVAVKVRGRDAEPGAVRFESDRGERARLAIVFPVEKHDRYVYPELGRGSTSMQFRDSEEPDSWLAEVLDALFGRRIHVSGSGRGLELWADVTVRVPAGAAFGLVHGVGAIEARGVEADLALDNSSGNVVVEDVRGELHVDTGSGSVEVARVAGDVTVSTGSGSVEVAGVGARNVVLDTGSGSVDAREIKTRRLVVDTGSGRVTAERVEAESAVIDTGSGSVTLELTEMGDGDFVIDTGSGSITLVVPETVSAEVDADTGSGGVDFELRGARVLHQERNELQLVVGDGDAHVRLDTGSGAIRIHSSG